MKKIILGIVVVLVVALGVWAAIAFTSNPQQQAVSGASPSSTPPVAPAAPTSTVTAAPSATTSTPVIQSAFFGTRTSTALGTYLTDANGRTLYLFTKDATDTSTCYGPCAALWPPYGPKTTATGRINLPALPAGAGVMRRTDGTSQFTWNGMPLYYYSKDIASGDTLGQGLKGVWFVVNPQ